MENRDALCERLNERFRTDTAINWTHKLVEAGIPAGPVYTMDKVFADPHVIHQNMIEEVEHPHLGRINLIANPLRMEGFKDGSVRTPPPGLGEQSREVLAEYGYAKTEIDALVESGAVGD